MPVLKESQTRGGTVHGTVHQGLDRLEAFPPDSNGDSNGDEKQVVLPKDPVPKDAAPAEMPQKTVGRALPLNTLLRRLQVYVSMFIFPLSRPSTLGEPVRDLGVLKLEFPSVSGCLGFIHTLEIIGRILREVVNRERFCGTTACMTGFRNFS